MKKSIESQIKSIRFDAEKFNAVVKEDLTNELVRIAAIEIANRLTHELVILGSGDD